ncbi:NUDIX domain-containing protein [Thermodesulfobacteriota bacterium]
MECPQCGHHFENYKNPLVTVDLIIEIQGGIVLIERKNQPYGWALPGGFVDYGESLEQAAVREALEETGLHVTLKQQLKTYSDPDRDPRHHTISTVFIAIANGSPRAGDDASKAKIFTEQNLPAMAFDHAEILMDYYTYKTNKASHD